MSKVLITNLLNAALQELQQSGKITVESQIPSFTVEPTKSKEHGDFASNIALVAAKLVKKNPKELAQMIVSALPANKYVEKVEIAGPGFINFFLTKEALYAVIEHIHKEGQRFGTSHHGQGKKILVEFVSSNPTGPLHVGHGRHAAYGAVVSDLLKAVGYNVSQEYYVNDDGRQMDILAVSTWLRYLKLLQVEHIVMPSNAYKGEYVIVIARMLQEKVDTQFSKTAAEIFQNLPKDEPEGGDKEIYIDAMIARAKQLLGEKNYQIIFSLALKSILADIKDDLSDFGVHFDNWFSEREFVQSDVVDKMIQKMQAQNLLYELDGALWFRSTNFNDEKDRVLQRANGKRTYFANDLAYHLNKFERGFDSCIDIFGSDHHGYIPRMKAGLTANGINDDKLKYLLVQFVTLYRNGVQVQMSTRSGSFVTLRELREEVGNDAARYFYVMRKSEQHIDFDLDLAKSQSNENPVFYIQYAHARICSVLQNVKVKGFQLPNGEGLPHLTTLVNDAELTLLATLNRYPDIIHSAAVQFEPHILTNYLRDLATDFHAYYNNHQFLVDDANVRNARLTLILATRQVIANGLKLLGISAPEKM